MKKYFYTLALTLILVINAKAQDYYMDTQNGTTVTACQGNVFPSWLCSDGFGRPTYCNNEDYTVTFYSGSPGTPIRISFLSLGLISTFSVSSLYFDTEAGFDFLRIYNGPSTASPLLATLSGTAGAPFNYTGTGGYLTLRFTSDVGVRGFGWWGIIGCQPSSCNGNLPASDVCVSSPAICDLNGYCGSTSGWYTPDNMNLGVSQGGPFCAAAGVGSIENNSWIKFIPNSTSATINFTSAACSSTTQGVQAAIFSTPDCSTFGLVTCTSQATGQGAASMSGTTFIPGNTYYVMIDGYAGNSCQYTITASSGIAVSTIAATSTVICNGQSTGLVITAPGSSPSYSWSNGATTSSINVSPSVTTVYSGTVSSGFCNEVLTRTITVNPTPTSSASISQPSITCAVPNPQLTGTTNLTAPISYSWSGPSGFTSTSQTPNITNPGTYSLTVTKNGCTSTIATVAAAINTIAPSYTPTQTGTITCATLTTALQSNIAGMNYTWTAPGGASIIGGTTNSVNAIGQGSGVYTVTVRDPLNGCSRTATVNVPLNTTTPLLAVATPPDITCASTSVVLNATGSNLTYTWSGPGVVAGGSTSTPTVNAVGNYTVNVTSTVNGCTNTAVVSVTNNLSVSALAATVGSVTCLTNTIQLNASPAGMNYTWTAPGGSAINSGGNTANAIGQGSGNYTLTVQNPINGCVANSIVAANVNTATIPAIPSTTGTITCVTNSVNLSVSAGSSYTWVAPGGSSVLGLNSQNAVGIGPGTYTVTIRNPINGCPTTTLIAAQINTTVITPTISSPSILTCTVTSISLSALPASGVSYSWTSVNPMTGTNVATPTISAAGNYSLVVTNTINGCPSNPSVVAVSQNTVAPTFVLSGITQTVGCNATAQLIGSANPSTCTPQWQGVSGGATTYTATVSGPGTYTLNITNPSNGCTASTIYTVTSSNAPVVNLANTNTITCSTTTSQINATSTITTLSYTWNGPGIVGSTTNSNVLVNTGGTYTLIALNTSNNCTVAITQAVPFNTTAVTASVIVSNTTISCANSSVALTATAIANGGSTPTYSWIGPGIIGSPTLATISGSVAGNYTATITNAVNGCTGTAVGAITINTLAPANVSVNPATFSLSCATSTAQLNATSASTNVTYVWIPPAGGSIISGSANANAIINGQGVYTVVVTNAVNGCTASAQSTITPNVNAPSLTVSNNNLQITCSIGTPSAAVNTTVTDVTYNWAPSTGISGATNASIATFTNAGTYTCLVTNTINSCVSNAIITVTMNNTLPTASLTSVPFITCSNTLVTLNPVYTPTLNLTYSWTGTGIVGTSTNSSVNTSTTSPLTVTFTNTANGCTGVATFTPNSDLSAPIVSVTPVTGTIMALSCNSPSLQITASVTPVTNLTYTWSTGATTPSISITNPGTYSIAVTNTLNGCSSGQQQFTVSGGTVAPTFSLATTASISCGSATTALSVSTATGSAYSYNWSGPALVSGSNTANPVVGAGVYTVLVTNTITNCTATQTVNVTTNNVNALFTANPLTGPAPLDVTFINGSSGATSYIWNYGNGQISNSTNGAATYTQAGVYVTTLTASSGPCISTYTMAITVEEGLTIGEIPNTFTPNGDGVNDLFTLPIKGAKTINFELYNRWGGIMYRAFGSKVSWDGIADNGNAASDGTYFYVLKIIGFDDKEVVKSGNLTLFR
jgi:gliding motility-associated-like protein